MEHMNGDEFNSQDVGGTTPRTSTAKYAKQDLAKKRITKHFDKQFVAFDPDALDAALSQVYDECAATNSAPTVKALVDALTVDSMKAEIASMEKDPFRPKSKAPVVAAIVVVLAVCACVGAFAYHGATKVGALYTQVNAEGWNKDTSTPVEVVVYQGDVKAALEDDDETNDPEGLVEVVMDANTQWGLEEVTERGTYTLEVSATPILEDGTMFKSPDIQVVSLEGENTTATFDLEKLDLSTASAEEIEAATQAAEEAAAATGDESKVAAVTSAATKASEKASSANSSNGNSSSSGGSSSNSGSASSGGSSSNGGNTSSGGSSSSDSTSKPAHTHSWVEQYKNVSTPIYSERIVCSCGDTFSSNAAWSAHNEENLLSGGSGHSYSVKSVQTGTDTQKVVTGYKCSTCGATK